MGIDFDWVGDKMGTFFTKASDCIRESSSQINFVAMAILNIIAIAIAPWSYLAGLAISICVTAGDIALGNKIATFINRFVSNDPAEKTTLLASLGLMSAVIYPPFFSFSLGMYSGKTITELTSGLIHNPR
jgi:hypothetical protein